MKHSAPSQSIDVHTRDEGRNGKQKNNNKLEEDLTAIVGHFVQVCRRRGLKVNTSKRKVMVLGGEEEFGCDVCVDGIRLEHASEFNIWGVFWTNRVQMRMVASLRRLAGAIRSLINARGL